MDMTSWSTESLCAAFPKAQVLTPKIIHAWCPKRNLSSHKYTNGTLLALVGSKQYPGAAILSLRAAARVGVGLVRALAPECLWLFLPLALPEAIPTVLPCDPDLLKNLQAQANAFLVGCGLGREALSQKFAHTFMVTPRPMVVDGDGLAALRCLPEETYRDLSQGRWLLTPHGGELQQLIPNLPQRNLDFLKIVQDKADAWLCTFLIKGFPGIIVAPQGEMWICPPGDPAATTAGCGDVLAGACAGYLAQGVSPVQAAALGSLAVAIATHAFLRKTHAHTLLASDLVAGLGELHESLFPIQNLVSV